MVVCPYLSVESQHFYWEKKCLACKQRSHWKVDHRNRWLIGLGSHSENTNLVVVGKNRAEFWTKGKQDFLWFCTFWVQCGWNHCWSISAVNISAVNTQKKMHFICVGIETLCTVMVCCNSYSFDSFMMVMCFKREIACFFSSENLSKSKEF